MSDVSRATIYPRYCFHLSPTANTWCLLRASEIHDLEQHDGFEGENFFFYSNLPIKWVRVVGVVVAVDDFAGRRAYTIDDSSGACIESLINIPNAPAVQTLRENAAAQSAQATTKTIGLAHPTPTRLPYQGIDVGVVVDVKGGLYTFRDERQIKIEKMVAVKSTTQEVALWEKRTKFRRDVLSKPWVLRSRDVRRCRKEAERSEADAERKKKRVESIAKDASAGHHMKPLRRGDAKKESRGASAEEIRGILRDEAAKGKYNALGL